jgi:hypothetical protein
MIGINFLKKSTDHIIHNSAGRLNGTVLNLKMATVETGKEE